MCFATAAADDSVADSDSQFSVQVAITSADRLYNDTVYLHNAVRVKDDEVASVLVAPMLPQLTEGVAGSFGVRLTSRPTADVVIQSSVTRQAGALESIWCFDQHIGYDPGLAGHNTTVESDAQSCQDRCMAAEGCSRFSFAHGTCGLHAVGASAVARHGAVSGPPRCDSQDTTVCHTAVPGEECHGNVQLVMEGSVRPCSATTAEPTTFEEFQFYLHTASPEHLCPLPCSVDSSTACAAAIEVSWSGSLSLGPTTITFNSSNWDTLQTVDVQPADDDVDLGTAYRFSLRFVAQSSDPSYDGTVSDVTLSVYDDDTANVVLIPSRISAPIGHVVPYILHLGSMPLDHVAVDTSWMVLTQTGGVNATVCADEGEHSHCFCSGRVRYGARNPDRWSVWLRVQTSTVCSSAVFGDPAPGTAKTCECEASVFVLGSPLAPSGEPNSEPIGGAATGCPAGYEAIEDGPSCLAGSNALGFEYDASGHEASGSCLFCDACVPGGSAAISHVGAHGADSTPVCRLHGSADDDYTAWDEVQIRSTSANVPITASTWEQGRNFTLYVPETASNIDDFVIVHTLRSADPIYNNAVVKLSVKTTTIGVVISEYSLTVVEGGKNASKRSTDPVKINFQPSAMAAPGGYLADVGGVHGDRSNGHTYGWNCNLEASPTDQAFDRLSERSRNSSLLFFDRGDECDVAAAADSWMAAGSDESTSGLVWDIVLPNGQYRVMIGYSDPSNATATHGCTLEGISAAADPASVPAGSPVEVAVNVMVSDGRLTLAGQWSSGCESVSYLEITAHETGCDVCSGGFFVERTEDEFFDCQCDLHTFANSSALVCSPLLGLGNRLSTFLEGHGSVDGGTMEGCMEAGGEPDMYSCAAALPSIQGEGDAALCSTHQGMIGRRCCAGFDAAAYSVQLGSMPTAPVVLTVEAVGGITVSPAELVFTESNWSVPAMVAVEAIDDFVAEPVELAQINHRIASADALYATLVGIPSVNVSVADNDIVEIELSMTSVTITEAAGRHQGAIYTVRLGSEPRGTVSIDITMNATELTASPGVLFFDDMSWNTPQNITIAGTNDDIDEGDATGVQISHQPSSDTDIDYNTLVAANITVTVRDNDEVGLIVGASAGNVTEGDGSSFRYSVRLATQPVVAVAVAVTLSSEASEQVMIQPFDGVLTFEPENWELEQWVTVSAVNDHIAEETASFVVEHRVESGDPRYDGLSFPPRRPHELGCDVCSGGGGIFLERTEDQFFHCRCDPHSFENSTSLVCSAVGMLGTLVVGHGSLNGGTVEGCLDAGGEPESWSCAAVLPFSVIPPAGADDVALCGSYQSVVGGQCCTGFRVSDTGFYSVLVSVLDNNIAGVVVDVANITLVEGSDAASICVRLSSEPREDVFVVPFLASAAEPAASVSTGTTAAAHHGGPRRLQGATDGGVTPGEPTSGGTSGGGAAGEPTGGPTGEPTGEPAGGDSGAAGGETAGGRTAEEDSSSSWAADYLGDQPQTLSANMSAVADLITIGSAAALTALDGLQLHFTGRSWNSSLCFEIWAEDDHVAEQTEYYSVRFATTSTDSGYSDEVEQGCVVSVVDDDEAGLAFDASALAPAVSENGLNATYSCRLSSQPLEGMNVTIEVAEGRSRPGLVVSPHWLGFNGATWNTTQLVTVSVLDDEIYQGDVQIVLSHHLPRVGMVLGREGAADVEGFIYNVSVAVEDDDWAEIRVSAASLQVTEHNSESATVELTRLEVGNASRARSVCNLAGSQLAILSNAADFEEARLLCTSFGCYVGLSAELYGELTSSSWDDADFEADNSSSNETAPILSWGNGTVLGNLSAPSSERYFKQGLLIVPPSEIEPGMTMFAEVRATDESVDRWNDGTRQLHSLCSNPAHYSAEYAVRLGSMPTAPVVLTVEAVGGITVSPAELVFTESNWSVPAMVAVEAIDDFVAEPVELAQINHRIASADALYATLVGIPSVNVSVADNDIVEIELSMTSVTITEAAGRHQGAIYTVRLGAMPGANVIVDIFAESTLSADADVRLSQSEITFSPLLWDVGQTIVVSTINDGYDEGESESVVVVHRIRDGPVGKSMWNLSVTVTDDDTAPVPLHYTLTGASAGPLSGGTVLTLAPEMAAPSDVALFHFLLSWEVDVQCRFLTQVSSTTVLTVADVDLSSDTPSIICRSPAVQPDVPSTLQNTELSSVEVSVAGRDWVQTRTPFTFFAPFSVGEPAPLAGPDSGGTAVIVPLESTYVPVSATCRFGGTVMPAALEANSLACSSPSATLREDLEPAQLLVSLNGQQYVPTGTNFTFYSSALPAGPVAPTSGPVYGGTDVRVQVERLFALPGSWACRFAPVDGIAIVQAAERVDGTHHGGPRRLQGTSDRDVTEPPGESTGGGTSGGGATEPSAGPTGEVSCRSPAVLVAASYSLSVSVNGQQYIETGVQFVLYTVPDISALSILSVPIDHAETIRLTGSIAESDTALVRLTPVGQTESNRSEIQSITAASRSTSNEISIVLPDIASDNRFVNGSVMAVAVSLNGVDFHETELVLSVYNPQLPPAVDLLRPRSGAKEGGSNILVTGQNFAGVQTLSCFFGTTSAPATFLSSRSARCVAPANVGAGGDTVPGLIGVTISNGDLGYGVMMSDQYDDDAVFRYTETSAADSVAAGSGIGATSTAGVTASFTISANTATLAARTTGGDFFYVDLQDEDHSDVFGVVADLDPDYYDASIFAAPSVYSGAQASVESMMPRGGSYAAIYRLTHAGTYSVKVTAGGIHISGSPFLQVIIPDALHPQSSKLWMPRTTMAAARRNEFAAYLQFADQHGNNRTDTLATAGVPVNILAFYCTASTEVAFDGDCSSSTTAAPASLSTLDSSPGMLNVDHMFTVSGVYRLECVVGGETVVTADISQTFVVKPAETSRVELSELPASAVAGVTQDITLSSYDEFGNSREVGGDAHELLAEHENATLDNSNRSVAAMTTVDDLLNSTYAAVFFATVAGRYALSVQLDGVDVTAPLAATGATGRTAVRELLVVPNELDLPTCVFTGAGFLTGAAGVEATFDVYGNDRYGNLRLGSDGGYSATWQHGVNQTHSFTAESMAHHPDNAVHFALRDWVHRDHPGIHTIAYNTTVAGEYLMNVSFGSDISNISFGSIMFRQQDVIVFPAPTDARTSIAFGAGLEASLAGQFVSFYIILRDAFGNDRT